MSSKGTEGIGQKPQVNGVEQSTGSLEIKVISDADQLIPLLPEIKIATHLMAADTPPCLGGIPKLTPISEIFGPNVKYHPSPFVRKCDLDKVPRKKDSNGAWRHDFDEKQYSAWVEAVEQNTATCGKKDGVMGRGLFIPPGKKLEKNTFITTPGIWNFNLGENTTNPNNAGVTNNEGELVALIEPEKQDGPFNIINSAFFEKELACYFVIENGVVVATANLSFDIKYFNGYPIYGVVVPETIYGNEHGVQLFWNYASLGDYFDADDKVKKQIVLCNGAKECHGIPLDNNKYSLRTVNFIFMEENTILRATHHVTVYPWVVIERNPYSTFIVPHASNPAENMILPYAMARTYIVRGPDETDFYISMRPTQQSNKQLISSEETTQLVANSLTRAISVSTATGASTPLLAEEKQDSTKNNNEDKNEGCWPCCIIL